MRPFSIEILYSIADALGVRPGDRMNATLRLTKREQHLASSNGMVLFLYCHPAMEIVADLGGCAGAGALKRAEGIGDGLPCDIRAVTSAERYIPAQDRP